MWKRPRRPVRSSHLITAGLCGLTAAVIGALFAAGVASSSDRAARGPQRLTLYSVATAEQDANYSDDRQRGYGNNPFGNFKDTTSTVKKTKVGPFPGDLVYFEETVYKDAALKMRVGTASVTCQFNQNKLSFCDANYLLHDGTLLGTGPIDFKSSSFAIAIVGGSGKYQDLRGELDAAPAAHRAQRLIFELS